MVARNVRSGSTIVALSVLLLLIIAVVNLIADRVFTRLDLTENREYTISSSTKKLLRNLDDVVNIKVYFSKDLPSYMASLPKSVRDLTDEFSAFGRGKVRVQWEDPDASPEQANKLRSMGIPQVQLDVIQKDKREVANVYLGMAVLYEDRHEVLPVVQGPWGLEYELVAAILKVTRTENPKVGIVSRYGQQDLDARYSEMLRALRKQYDVEVLDLEGGAKAIADDLTTLVLLGPKDLSDLEKYRIDQFIMRGGKILAMLDALELEGGVLQGSRMSSGMEDMVARYGIRCNNDLVVDPVSATASFASGFFRFMSNYYLWPKVIQQGFNREHPVISKLESMSLPWTRSFEAVSNPPDSVEVTLLASSSANSWTTTDFTNLNPQQQWNPKPEDLRPRGLAYAVTGVIPSFFAGRPVPAPADSGAAPVDDAERRDSSLPTQIIVLGSTYFCIDQQLPGNMTFLLNSVDWMSLGDELIGIRSRQSTDRPLKAVSEGTKRLVRILGIALVPVLIVIVGFARWLAGSRVRKLAETETGGVQ
ncbi:GldG family protein [Candidatus Fermentibacteria bacterium]|nr:GldG family protein [Candidatus Fermentibacteria bacterium]